MWFLKLSVPFHNEVLRLTQYKFNYVDLRKFSKSSDFEEKVIWNEIKGKEILSKTFSFLPILNFVLSEKLPGVNPKASWVCSLFPKLPQQKMSFFWLNF